MKNDVVTHAGWGDKLVLPAEELRTRYREAGEWSEAPLPRRFHQSAQRFADRPALITAELQYTYEELDRRTDTIAAGLLRLGLRPRDPVVFQVTNRAETVLAWYGCLKAGLIPVATLAAHRMHEIGHITGAVGARAHVVEANTTFDLVEFAGEVAQVSPTMDVTLTIGEDSIAEGRYRIEDLGADIDPVAARHAVEEVEGGIDPLDIAVFQLSGGTTGVPKVIPRIHAEYWENARLYAERLNWTPDTKVAHLIPLTHNAGVSCALHATHAVGAALVLADPDPVPAFELMTRAEATDALFGHGHYQALFLDEFEPARRVLRQAVLSGAKVPEALFDRVDDGGDHWAGQMFGMGEGMFLASPPDSPRLARLTTVGTPIAQTDEYRILDPNSEEQLLDGQVGELVCRGPYTISGYFDAPEHNARAFTSDGFYRTGDLAAVQVIDGGRYLSIEGRMKDLINRGGEKINAEEVEKLLISHPGIDDVAVVAMPDPRLGERTCAYLVATADELSMADVQAHLDGLGVAKFKWPERLEWVPGLPRTNVGKVNKVTLRADINSKIGSQQ